MAAWKRSGGLEPFEQRLKSGMNANGYRAEFADAIYRQILGFGEYGFPESHSASFALLVYVSFLAQVPSPGGVLRGAAQQPADGLLRAGSSCRTRAGTASRCGRRTCR